MAMNHDEGSSSLSWESFCHEYERRVEPFTSQFAEELIQGLDGNKLLDVGCGTGAIAMLAENWNVAVTDISEAMVKRTLERANTIVDSSITDGTNLPSHWSESFDAATANFSVIFFPDPTKGLREIHRCLKPGIGRVGLTAWGNASETPAFRVFPDAIAESHPKLVETNRPKRITGSVETLQKLLKEAGFVDIVVKGPVAKTLIVSSAEEYYDRFALTSPPTAATIAKLSNEQRLQFRLRVMELATERGGQADGSIALDSSAYFAYGRKL